MRLPAQFRGTSTRAALIVATGVLASCISIPLSWHKARAEGAAQAARSTPTASRPPTATLPADADHPTVQPSDKAEAETWSDPEIITALEECVRLLTPTGADLEVSKPIRNGQCGTPAPVLLQRVAGVEMSPPALVNCRLAAKLHQWTTEKVQPIAQEVFGTSVRRIVTASAYMCRQRIGTSNDRPSEHSYANALDISAFVLTDGRSMDVLTSWGRTARDRQAQAKTGKPAGGDARPIGEVEIADGSSTKEGQFLRRMHESACEIFGTVLGPEANEAHRNHFHLDLAARRHSAFCE
jgi:hypothetical protein